MSGTSVRDDDEKAGSWGWRTRYDATCLPIGGHAASHRGLTRLTDHAKAVPLEIRADPLDLLTHGLWSDIAQRHVLALEAEMLVFGAVKLSVVSYASNSQIHRVTLSLSF